MKFKLAPFCCFYHVIHFKNREKLITVVNKINYQLGATIKVY